MRLFRKQNARNLAVVFLVALCSRLFMTFFYSFVMWDGSVYLLNAQYFLGDKIYFEEFRPPLLAFLISLVYGVFGVNELLARFVPVIFSALFIVVIYKLGEELFDAKVGAVAAVLTIFNPYHLEWSSRFYTGLLSSTLAMLSLLYINRGLKKEGKNVYLSFIFAGLATLSRYVYLALLPLLIALRIIFREGSPSPLKRVFLDKKVYAGIFLFFAVLFPWLFFNQMNYGNPWHSFSRANEIISGNEYTTEFGFYIKKSIEMFSVMYFIFPIALFYLSYKFAKIVSASIRKRGVLRRFIAYRSRSELRSFTILFSYLVGFIIYFQFVLRHKEVRYLWPLFMPVALLSALFIVDFIKKMGFISFNKSILALAIILLLMLSGAFIPRINELREPCGMRPIIDASKFVGANGRFVMSPLWTLVSYYGSVRAVWMPWEDKFDEDFLGSEVDFIVTTDKVIEPEYSKNMSFFSSREYLSFVASFSDSCQNVWIYRRLQ